ncbi:MAG: exodeoxyribonuclease III [Betaproteobacteria bacterium]
MRFASWNVNSLKVRLPHLLQWLKTCDDRLEPIDLIGLQELKMTDDKFPIEDLEKAGFLSLFMGQKTYNGVAILVRKSALTHLNQDQDTAFLNIQQNLPNFVDEQKRLLASTLHFKETAPIRVICAYFPNGQAPGTEKFLYKLQWLSALKEFLVSELQKYPRLILMGDFNIAPRDEDVHDPAKWVGQNLVSPEERAFFNDFQDIGLIDSFRLFDQEAKSFSWWDYRMMGFRRNAGMRIDHVMISQALKEDCTACVVDKTPRKWEQPSDHAPVILSLKK